MPTFPAQGSSPYDGNLKIYIDGSISDSAATKADLVSGKVPVTQVAVGGVLAVHYTGSSWPARPTTRTDVTVLYCALTNTDPAPTDFVANVDFLFKPS